MLKVCRVNPIESCRYKGVRNDSDLRQGTVIKCIDCVYPRLVLRFTW